MKKLVSIHDVAPETLGPACEILNQVERVRPGPVTLLVIPGRHWKPAQLRQLSSLQARGHDLAAHGWSHRVESSSKTSSGSWKHRLHSTLLSADPAEHLALQVDSILELMQRSFAWFEEVGLDSPNLYVPPGWALGDVPPLRLRETSFETVEVFAGLLEVRTGQLTKLPLVGRSVFRRESSGTGASAHRIRSGLPNAPVQAFCAWNRRRAERYGRLRVALHPSDLDNELEASLLADLREEPRDVPTNEAVRWASG